MTLLLRRDSERLFRLVIEYRCTEPEPLQAQVRGLSLRYPNIGGQLARFFNAPRSAWVMGRICGPASVILRLFFDMLWAGLARVGAAWGRMG